MTESVPRDGAEEDPAAAAGRGGRRFAALALCALAGYALFKLFWPHAGALIGAATLGIAFHPLHIWVESRWRKRAPTARAAITSALVSFFFIAPLLLVGAAAVGQADRWQPAIQSWREGASQWRDGSIVDSNPAMKSFRGWMQRTFAVRPSQLRRHIGQNADRALDGIGEIGVKLSAGTAAFLTEVGLMVIALFFVFRDGARLYDGLQSYLPWDESQKSAVRERVAGTVTGVVRGWLLCAVAQGLFAGFAYLVAGVELWVLFSLMTMLTGLIPFIGTALVWVPVGVITMMEGRTGAGGFILGWGLLVVSVMDNFLRPYVAGHRLKIHFVYLFFALLGGIELWGLKGIILGPVLVALAPVAFEAVRGVASRPGAARRVREREAVAS